MPALRDSFDRTCRSEAKFDGCGKLRNASKYADSRMFAEAAGAARKAFQERNRPLEFK